MQKASTTWQLPNTHDSCVVSVHITQASRPHPLLAHPTQTHLSCTWINHELHLAAAAGQHGRGHGKLFAGSIAAADIAHQRPESLHPRTCRVDTPATTATIAAAAATAITAAVTAAAAAAPVQWRLHHQKGLVAPHLVAGRTPAQHLTGRRRCTWL